MDPNADLLSGSFMGATAAMERSRFAAAALSDADADVAVAVASANNADFGRDADDDDEDDRNDNDKRSGSSSDLPPISAVGVSSAAPPAALATTPPPQPAQNHNHNHKRHRRAALGVFLRHRVLRRIPGPIRNACWRTGVIIMRPPIISQLLGTFVGLIAPLQRFMYGPDAPLQPITSAIAVYAAAAVPITNFSMAAGLGVKMKTLSVKHFCGGEPGGITRRTTFLFVVTRMVLIPCVLIGATYAITPYLPQDRLLLMVLYIEAITPSANMVVVVPQILGQHDVADALSLLVLAQYIVALPTMLAFLSLALYLTKDIGAVVV